MHELSITESILEISLRHAKTNNANIITNLYLVVGQLASIIDDSVQFYWDIISKDTIAEGALLHFRRLPAQFVCAECNHHFAPNGNSFSCPHCDSERVKIISGDEFYIEAIDIDADQ